MARQKVQKINIPSKKALAAKARRRASKAPKGIYDKEKMTLNDAIAVLRVRLLLLSMYATLAYEAYRPLM